MRRFSFFLAVVAVISTTLSSRADDPIPVEVLSHIKSATAFIKVYAGPVQMTGTGFLMQVDGDSALLVTNEHVVVPPKGPKLPPVRIEVVFNSGRKTETRFPAEVVAADGERDLAILRVKNAKDLPKPLDLTQKVELTETMPVFLFGFPFGTALSTSKGNPAITIGKGGISSLRENDRGEIAVIQIDGDLNPGNSGGPVVDNKGRLVGVAVAKVSGTNIGMAIPARVLSEMLNGRISGMSRRIVKVENGAAEIEFRVQFIDPLNKIVKASILVAPVSAVKEPIRADKNGKFPPLPAAEVVELKIADQVGTGKMVLKSDQKGSVPYYFQPSYVKGDQSLTYTGVGKPALINFSNAIAKVDPKTGDAPKPITGGAVPSGWTELSPKHCTYAASFPGDGTVRENEDSIVAPRIGQIRIFRAVLARKDGSTYITSQINLPPTLVKDTLKSRQDLLRDLAIEEFKGKLVEEKRIEMAGLIGKEYLIETPKQLVRFRLIGPGVQIYRIVIVGTKEQVNSKDVDVFFDNFKRVSRITPKPDKDK